MNELIPILKSAPLFEGISGAELTILLPTLSPKQQSFIKGDLILRAGQKSERIGVLLSGQVEGFRLSPDGTTMPVPSFKIGGIFGDVLGGASVSSPVTIQAASDCLILWLPYTAILTPNTPFTTAHARLLQNLLRSISDKYFDLMHRVDLLVQKSLRAKLSAYLLGEASAAGSNTFTTPFTRAKLADYLNCERSALCRELSRMQQEGLIETYKKSFKLLLPEQLSHFA